MTHKKGIILLFLIVLPLLSFLSVQPVRAFDPDTDIFFEYGAESGELQPPWDMVEGDGIDYGLAEVRSDKARTLNKSIYMYQILGSPADPKTDHERRVHLREYGVNYQKTEGYVSWWMYISSQMLETTDATRVTLGGWQLWFGDSEHTWMWWEGGRFRIMADKRLQYSYKWGNAYGYGFDSDASAQADEEATSYNMNDYENQWVHLQIYWKIAMSGGETRFWFNNDEVATITGLHSDPRYYSDSWNNNPQSIARGYSGQTYFRYTCGGEYPNFGLDLYQDTDSFENWIWVDDFVGSDTKVSESYGVGGVSSEFESWENGFEEGDFSMWNSTDYSGGGYAPSVTSTYAWEDTYSANFTTDGSDGSTANAMHIIQNASEINQRTKVRFEDLPDTNNTRMMVLRIGSEDDPFITGAGVYNMSGNYYWAIDVIGSPVNPPENYTLATINPDVWYNMEVYFNATVNGNITLWVDEVLFCQILDDFSSYEIQYVYPYLYVEDAQASQKTVYHDNYRVDDVYIGLGSPEVFQAIMFFSESDYIDPLQYVTINGTRTTDASGQYEWGNLAYDTEYVFVVGNATGYYPAWVINVDSFLWNGTHYIITKTISASENGYVVIAFQTESDLYINSSNANMVSASITSSSFTIVAEDNGTKTINASLADRGEPHTVSGLAGWSFDSSTNIYSMTVTFSSSQSISLRWGSVVGTSLNYEATYYLFQKKTFYASTRFWVFYSDGQNLVFRSATDGTIFNNSTVFVSNITDGGDFSLVFDGIYTHFAYRKPSTTNLTYRRGQPMSNGTLVLNDEQETTDTGVRPYISVDSGGYVWVAYNNATHYNVVKNSLNNGSWSTASGFPYYVSASYTPIIIPFSDSMYLIYADQNQPLKAKRYEGGWRDEEIISGNRLVGSGHNNDLRISATSYGSVIHVAFIVEDGRDYAYHIIYSDGTWTTPSLIDSAFLFHVSLTSSANIVYAFFQRGTYDIIHFTRFIDGSWETFNVDWLSENTFPWDALTSFYDIQSNRVGIAWTTTTFVVKFAWFYTETSNNFLMEGLDGVTVTDTTYSEADGTFSISTSGSGSLRVNAPEVIEYVLVNGVVSSWTFNDGYMGISGLTGTSVVELHWSVLTQTKATGEEERELVLDVIDVIKPVISPLGQLGLYGLIIGMGVVAIAGVARATSQRKIVRKPSGIGTTKKIGVTGGKNRGGIRPKGVRRKKTKWD